MSQKYRVPVKSLRRWSVVGYLRVKGGGRKPIDPNLKVEMKEWYFNLGKTPSTKEIGRKAREFCSSSSFKGSKGWVAKFQKYILELSAVNPKSL